MPDPPPLVRDEPAVAVDAEPVPAPATTRPPSLNASGSTVLPALRVAAWLNDSGPCRLLVDPGAARSLVAPAVAWRLGLAPRSSETRRGVGGVVQVGLVPDVRLRLGNAPERRIQLGITHEIDRIALELGGDFDGCVGHDYLRDFGLRFDVGGPALRLISGGWLGFAETGAIAFELGPPRRPIVLVPVQLNDRPPAVFVLDPGAAATVLAPHCAAVAGVTGTGSGAALGNSGAVAVWFGRVRRLAIAGRVLEDVTVAIGPTPGPLGDELGRRLDGVLGQDILRHASLELDFPSGCLRLVPRRPEAGPG